MKSGELARLAGVTVETLRFYERKNLLGKPARTASGYRAYTENHLEQLRFIRDCQALGFTLADIKPLLQLHAFRGQTRSGSDGRPGERMLHIVQDRLAAIEAKMEALGVMREYLRAALRDSEASKQPVCPARALRNNQEIC